MEKVNVCLVYKENSRIADYPVDVMELITPYGNITTSWDEPAESMMWYGKKARMFFNVSLDFPENVNIHNLGSMIGGLNLQVYDGNQEILLSNEASYNEIFMIRIMIGSRKIDLENANYTIK